MGTSRNTIYATWPGQHTTQWYRQVMGVRARWKTEAPGTYPTTYYIRQDDAGDHTGGGGAGTQADPYLMYDAEDIQLFYDDTKSGGYKSYLIERGSVIKCQSVALQMDEAFTHLGTWGTGNKPVWSNFEYNNDNGTGWTSTGTGAYYKTFTQAYWVRLQESVHANLTQGTETIFTKRTSQATVEANNDSFWFDTGALRLYVRIGANLNPATNLIQICTSNSKGIRVTNVDGVRVENQIAVGFGMGSFDGGGGPNGASQQYNIHVEVKDNNVCYIEGCEAYYSGHHALGHLVSGGGNAGGYTLWENCKSGLCRVDGNGEATIFIFYVNDGGHEYIAYDCECLYGGLPDSGRTNWSATAPRAGLPFYAHANSTSETGWGIIWKFHTHDHTYGCRYNGNLGNMTTWNSASTNNTVTTNYHGAIVGERFDGGEGTQLNLSARHFQHMWCRLLCKPPSASTMPMFQSSGTPDDVRPVSSPVGLRVKVDYGNITGTGNAPWTANASDQYYAPMFCHFQGVNFATAKNIAWDSNPVSSYRSARNRFFATTWAMDLPAGRPAINNCPNGTPTGATTGADSAVTGGGRFSAFWKTGTTIGTHTVYGPSNFSADYLGHDGHTGYIDLSASPDLDHVPESGDQVYQAVTDTSNFPYVPEWWMDDNGDVREFPATPSIGGLQKSGMPIIPEYASTDNPRGWGIRGSRNFRVR